VTRRLTPFRQTGKHLGGRFDIFLHDLSGDCGVRKRKKETAMAIHDFTAWLGTGEERRLADYRGRNEIVKTRPASARICIARAT
jgi:hypothetical protein